MERLSAERLTKSVYHKMRVKEAGADQWPSFRWKVGVRRACAERDMGLEEAKRICLDRGLWRSRVDGVPDG